MSLGGLSSLTGELPPASILQALGLELWAGPLGRHIQRHALGEPPLGQGGAGSGLPRHKEGGEQLGGCLLTAWLPWTLPAGCACWVGCADVPGTQISKIRRKMLGIPWGQVVGTWGSSAWAWVQPGWGTKSRCKRLMGADRHWAAPLHLI